MFAWLQNWTQIEGIGAITVTQSGPGWLWLDDFQDVTFHLEVREKDNAELRLDYDTAPSTDPTQFASMAQIVMTASTTPTVTRILLSQNPTLLLAGVVRWRITSLTTVNQWRTNFRIGCLAKRGR